MLTTEVIKGKRPLIHSYNFMHVGVYKYDAYKYMMPHTCAPHKEGNKYTCHMIKKYVYHMIIESSLNTICIIPRRIYVALVLTYHLHNTCSYIQV